MTSPNSGADVTAINNILGTLSGDADRIHIPGTVLEAGKTYEFRLGVANFLSPLSFENVTHSVVKAADPVPSLTLSSFIDLDTGEVYVSEELSIKAKAVVSVADLSAFVVFGTSSLLLMSLLLLLFFFFFLLFFFFF